MKSNEDFLKEVYEKADNKRAEIRKRNKTLISIGSTACALVICFGVANASGVLHIGDKMANESFSEVYQIAGDFTDRDNQASGNSVDESKYANSNGFSNEVTKSSNCISNDSSDFYGMDSNVAESEMTAVYEYLTIEWYDFDSNGKAKLTKQEEIADSEIIEKWQAWLNNHDEKSFYSFDDWYNQKDKILNEKNSIGKPYMIIYAPDGSYYVEGEIIYSVN